MRNATDISDTISSSPYSVRCILQKMDKRERLSDFVRRMMHEQGLTFRQVEARAKGAITGGYVNDIVKEKTTNPSIEKLRALAKGLNRSEDEVVWVARGTKKPSEDPEFKQSLFYLIYEKSQSASPEMKMVINRFLKMIDRELEEEAEKISPFTVEVNQLDDEKALKQKRA